MRQFDWKSTVDENVRAGFAELLLLQILSEGDTYGYEMKKAINERTCGVITFNEGSLYIPLLRMSSRGLISSYKEIVTGKRFRTYYHIEDLGKEYLEYGKKRCQEVFAGVTNLLFGKDEQNG